MNVLLAVDDDIHPPRTGGTQRSFGLARGLARAHRVQALCVVPNRSRGPARETVDGVRIVRTRAWQTSVLWRLDRAGVAPMFLARGVHDARLARTTRLIEGVPEVRMADLHLAGLLRPGTAALRVHHSHNVEYDRFRTARGPMCARATWAERLRALEGEVVASADLTVVCSDEDAARMHALHGVARDRFVVVPNGFDETAIAAPDATQRARARAALALADDVQVSVFVGSDWGPNREALAHLVERVFPALAAQGHALLVVGAVSRALAGRREPWLRVLGEVDDLAAALHAADVGLNPVQGGAGSNVKVPTMLAAGLAVVTTPFGLRGYAPLAPHVVIVEHADLVDALRARPVGWAARGERMPDALSDYAWGTLGARLGERFTHELALAGTKGAA